MAINARALICLGSATFLSFSRHPSFLTLMSVNTLYCTESNELLASAQYSFSLWFGVNFFFTSILGCRSYLPYWAEMPRLRFRYSWSVTANFNRDGPGASHKRSCTFSNNGCNCWASTCRKRCFVFRVCCSFFGGGNVFLWRRL